MIKALKRRALQGAPKASPPKSASKKGKIRVPRAVPYMSGDVLVQILIAKAR